ncbi:MAG: SAM-dependent methyltransferase [Firmicutes bacterium]|nr:SAM-dependent methyltransferase [Bacillota bacterium]
MHARVESSFRDPSGFLFFRDNVLYRQVNLVYRDHYDHLIESGLYETLEANGLLVPHAEVNLQGSESGRERYKIIRPEVIPFISYPYEWCFSQLRDAALTTLRIQRIALKHGMILKDASGFNIQFIRGKPILIDTLSFELYREGLPWVAYRQFCQHFLGPLALMARRDVRLSQMLHIFMDGIPLDLTSRLLPAKTWASFPLLSHLHIHGLMQKSSEHQKVDTKTISRKGLLAIIDSLESAVHGLRWEPSGTTWSDYYERNLGYTGEGLELKKRFVAQSLEHIGPKSVWDIGANTGVFSRLSASRGILTVSMDSDPAAVERNYLTCKERNESYILPLLVDISNPSANIGWDNRERISLFDRGSPDVILALALAHHLAISNNVPFARIAECFAGQCRFLIIEFVPKDDPKVQELLRNREDVFTDYRQEAFEYEFGKFFSTVCFARVPDCKRILYLMQRK